MKNVNYTFLLLVGLLMAPYFGQSQNDCANNLLPNPDFENADPLSGWSTNLGTAMTTDDAAEGNNAAVLTGYAQAQISETLPGVANKRYTFTAMAKVEGDILIEGQLIIKFLTSSYQPIGFAVSTRMKLGNGYEQYSVKDISPANTTYVQVAFYKRFGNGAVYVDDACLTSSDNLSNCDPAIDAPQFVRCPGAITYYTEGTSAAVTWGVGGYTCQSGDVNTDSHDSGDIFPLGTTTVTLTRTNFLGLSNTCAFDVTVIQIDPLDCSNNMLSNGGFENGFDSWDGNINNFSTLIPASNSGNNAAYLGASSLTELSQTVAATPGKKYTLQGFSKKIGDVGVKAGVAFTFYDDQMQFLKASNMDFYNVSAFSVVDYLPIRWQDTAPSGTAFLKVSVQKQSGAGYFTIDDLCLNSEDNVTPPPPPPGTCFNNLLTNADFEENSNFLVQWTATIPGSFSVSNDANSGDNAARLGGIAYAKLIQTVPAVPGEKFTLSAQVKAITSNYLIRLRFRNAQGFQLSTYQDSEPYTGEYQEVTLTTGEAPSNAATVSVELIKLPNLGEVLIDDVCLTKESTVDPCSPDVTPPSLSGCPFNITVNTAGGGTVVGGWDIPTATDFCSAVSLSSNYNSGDFFEPGSTTVVYTATDDAGNTSTCSFVVAVVESTGNTCVNNLLENPGFEADDNVVTDWDLSGAAMFTLSGDAFSGNNALEISGSSYGRIEQSFPVTQGEVFNLSAMIKSNFGDYYLRIKQRDASGGFLFTRLLNPISEGEYEEHTLSVTAVENAATIIVSFIKQPGSLPVLVDDFCFTKESTVDPCNPDITPPVISNCPSDIEVFSLGGGAVVATWDVPTATDLCSAVSLSSSHNPGELFSPGTTTVMYTATDDAGNTSTCTFIIFVLPTPNNSCVGNLLENAGFEDGDNLFTTWGTTLPDNVSISNDAYSGNNALRISGTERTTVVQTIPAYPGEQFTLSAQVKAVANNYDIGMEFQTIDGDLSRQRGEDYTGEYQNVMVPVVTAPPGTYSISVIIKKKTISGDVLVDDICLIREVSNPPPSSPCDDIDLDISNNQITISGLEDAAIRKVQIFNADWQLQNSCFGDCDPTPVYPIGNGVARVKVGRYTSGYELICEKRFDPIVTNGSALIVPEAQDLFYFKANKSQASALLNWTTNTTFAIEEFIVERSTALSNYTAIGTLNNNYNDDGIYNFQFKDEHPESGENNYRIKMIDRDGGIRYSTVKSVSFAFESRALTLFPNPAMDHLVVRLLDWEEVPATISIYNQLGTLMTKKAIGSTKDLRVRIDLNDFPAGVYTLLVTGEGKRPESRRFVVVDM